jgi:hypothetical protein
MAVQAPGKVLVLHCLIMWIRYQTRGTTIKSQQQQLVGDDDFYELLIILNILFHKLKM